MKASKNKTHFVLVLVVLTLPFLVAWQVGDEGVGFTADQLAVLTTFLLPFLAQIVKVYREKGGKKPKGKHITWVLFAVGVLLSVVWGNSVSFFSSISWPLFDPSEPLTFFSSIFGFVNSIVFAGGKVYGVASGYYLILKPLVFKYVPWLKTEKMKNPKAEA